MKNPITQIVKAVALRGTKRSPQWPEVRKHWLADHGFCRGCGGILNLEVHHKEPFHDDPARELDPTNYITLCEKLGTECHLHIGHLDNWKNFNPNVETAAPYTAPRLSV